MQINWPAVKQLVIKDWKLRQKMIAGYMGATVLSLCLLGYPHLYTFYMGCILLLTAMIGAGQQMTMESTITEQKEQTLPFILSLPINPATFAIAKIFSVMSVYLTIWTVMVVTLTFVVMTTHISNGILPMFWLICGFTLVGVAIVLVAAMVTESEGWTIFILVTCNIAISPFIMIFTRSPEFYPYFESQTIVWPTTATYVLLGEALLVVTLLTALLFIQARRTTFI